MMKRVSMFFIMFFLLFAGMNSVPAVCHAQTVQKEDIKCGTYLIDVSLSGGTGKASVTSPAKLVVSDEKTVVTIAWSSSNFDYMIVNNEQYFPINTEGNSVFEIPISNFDEEIEVAADTTAMSRPHEIEYTLMFHWESLKAEQNHSFVPGILVGVAAAVIAVLIISIIVKRKKSSDV